MANDVKALPVVAWLNPNDKLDVPLILDSYKRGAPHVFGRYTDALVYQSDAESALAELRAEVEGADREIGALTGKLIVAEQRADTAEARLAEVKRAIADLLLYFKSGNSIPVEKATIKADSPEIVTLDAFLGEGK